MDDILIEAKNLSKIKNEKTILKDINLTIKEGELVLIFGKSGAGKTTLLRILALIDKEYEGLLKLNFHSYKQDEIRLKEIGYIPQFLDMISSLTIEENIILPLELIGENRSVMKKKLDELTSILQIKHILDKYPNEVSGGELQRACIARALIKDPRIIIADEPTSHLDDEMEKKVISILEKFSKKKVTIILSSTHEYYPINPTSVYKMESGMIKVHKKIEL